MRWLNNSRLRQMGLCLIIIILLSGTALAETIRGRLMKVTRHGMSPAVYIPVVLEGTSPTMTAYTDPEGWYYFYNVGPGSYTVTIQTSQNVRRSSVYVGTGANVNVPQIIIP